MRKSDPHVVLAGVVVALALLTWLSERQKSLATMTQDDIDEWLEEDRGGRRHEIRFFLAWSASHGIGPEVYVQAPGRSALRQMLDEEERQGCLKQCISCDEGDGARSQVRRELPC